MANDDDALSDARTAYKTGDFDAAADAFGRILERAPDDLVALFGLGNALLELRRDDEALAPLRHAAGLSPQNPDIHNSLGVALRRLKRYPESIPHLEVAAAAYPERAGIVTNLANAYRADYRLEAAARAYRQALDQDDAFVEAYFGLGTCYRIAGQLEEAKVMLNHALALSPDHVDARFSRALLYLEEGNLTLGFADYECRWQSSDFPGRNISGTEWQGQDVDGRTLLVHAEQGIGDTIQFARFVPMLAAHGARVILYAQPELVPVLETLDGIDQVVPAGGQPPSYDYYVAVMSLPFHFGTTAATIPAPGQYLAAPKVNRRRIDGLLQRPGAALKIGLVWAGRSSHANDRHRSCRLEDLLPLLATPGCTFYSLQKETRPEDAEWLDRLVGLGPHLTDFGVTADAMTQMDLIVSVDTAAAHLAGALGRPTWVLLPYRAEWRWALAAETTPWYPTMRLARQVKPDDWAELVNRLAAGLTEIAQRES